MSASNLHTRNTERYTMADLAELRRDHALAKLISAARDCLADGIPVSRVLSHIAVQLKVIP